MINNVVGLLVLEVVMDKVTWMKFVLSLLEILGYFGPLFSTLPDNMCLLSSAILSSFEKGVKISKGVKAHLAREVLVVAAALAVLELAPKIRA